jgi:nitronate monooxygenase
VILAPMAGAGGVELAAAVIAGGGVGSLPGAMVSPSDLVEQAAAVRARVHGPLALNFFCHETLPEDGERDQAWLDLLQPFYLAEGVARPERVEAGRRPFDATAAEAVESVRPAIVSFHFGLPPAPLLARVRASGALVIATATTVAEAEWLAAQGCDAIVAQGFEAGGHAGWFLDGHRPVGTMALVPQVIDAVRVPVLAAGGIADARSVRAAMALGAAGVQVGTAYLACPESLASPAVRDRLGTPAGRDSMFISALTGRAARGFPNRLVAEIGPTHPAVPTFPRPAGAIAPLRARAERDGRADYSPLWAGQAAPLARPIGATTLTEQLGAAALAAMELSDAA